MQRGNQKSLVLFKLRPATQNGLDYCCPEVLEKQTCDLAFEFGRLIPSTVEGIHRHPRGMNLNLALLESKPVIIKYNSTTTTACTTYNH